MKHQHLPSPSPPTCVIPAVHIDAVDLDPEIENRATVHFLKAVSGSLAPTVEAPQPAIEARASRLISEAARSAEDSARYQHRRLVVAPLLMLLALGLLFAAGVSSC